MSSRRPSAHEICSKVDQALEAIVAGNMQIAVADHIVGDFEECCIYDVSDLWVMLPKLLTELKQAETIKCYAGKSPPTKSIEPNIRGFELWAYSWHSNCLGYTVYLKFCITMDKSGRPHYLHVRLHKSRLQ